ncbi:glutathione S-transferase family protein [Uliginosibacterium sp. 31-16]|uniref:glutathione S-transferase family protein n=1 Tax=Uliginosibacterium sp. 31-16 TaxID=3068315 RepID=UPI00273DC7FA|nr:glutathione S-transferase family protein [Uliginosibacterium sp. 31-16]MDP5239019.1 glutathione S-transferase family protein [Uliginosibacterium sp. 31-16]
MQLIIGTKTWSSWSLRAWLAAKASGLAFEEICIPLRQPDTKTRIEHFSPSGKVPCLIDNGLAVWDSLAIAEYLAEEVAPLWPLDGAARAVARAVSAEMHSGFSALRTHMSMEVGADLRGQGRTPEVDADIARITQIWKHCRAHYGSRGRYLFGEYSIADMMFAPVCFRFESYGVQLDNGANDYLQTMLAHPHMLEWKAAALTEAVTPAEPV